MCCVLCVLICYMSALFVVVYVNINIYTDYTFEPALFIIAQLTNLSSSFLLSFFSTSMKMVLKNSSPGLIIWYGTPWAVL